MPDTEPSTSDPTPAASTGGAARGASRSSGSIHALYTLLLRLLLPALFVRLAVRGLRSSAYFSAWHQRLGFVAAAPGDDTCLWVHAVSVGEVQAAAPVLDAMRARQPGLRILVTTTTPTGRTRLRQLDRDGVLDHCFLPYDLPGAMARLVRRKRPHLLVLMETELWPNLLSLCEQRGIPVVLGNARLSERSARRYARFPSLVRPMLARLRAIHAQTAADAQRFVGLGAAAQRVHVTGNLKLDVIMPASSVEHGQALRRGWGVERGVWIAASTHDPEEALVLDAFARVRRTHPRSVLVLVPRHPERAASIASLCRRRGFATVLRSETRTPPVELDVYLGDTLGELPALYAAADVAFVGGSLVGVGGHNMLEPAALGVPVIHGPHVFNFAQIAADLLAAGASRQVENAGELAGEVVTALLDANERHARGERGLAYVRGQVGALDRFLDAIDPQLTG